MILLTAFEPFGGLSANPTEAVVGAIAAAGGSSEGVITAVLPTEFRAGEERIRELIRAHRPDYCLSLGVAPGTAAIRLEGVARNRDGSSRPDNAGAVGSETIVPGGPAEYASGLPLDLLRAELVRAGVPTELSDDAGGYVCNRVFYAACHEAGRPGSTTRCGFVHVPLMREQPQPGDAPLPAWPLAELVHAVRTCIDVLRRFERGDPRG